MIHQLYNYEPSVRSSYKMPGNENVNTSAEDEYLGNDKPVPDRPDDA